MKRLMAAALCLGVAMVSYAQRGVWVRGAGESSCGEYIELRAARHEHALQDGEIAHWIHGYISGFNMEALRPTTNKTPDRASTLAYIDKHCRDNPLDNLVQATNELIKALGGRRRH